MPRNLTIKKSFWQKGFSNSACYSWKQIYIKSLNSGSLMGQQRPNFNTAITDCLGWRQQCVAEPLQFGSDTGIAAPSDQNRSRIPTVRTPESALSDDKNPDPDIHILLRNLCYSIYLKKTYRHAGEKLLHKKIKKTFSFKFFGSTNVWCAFTVV